MPTKREINAAWKVHDETEHDKRMCSEMPGWNEKLNHSVFNPGCKAWVRKYATEHPLPVRKFMDEITIGAPKKPCAYCHRPVREDQLFEEAVSGQLVCSRKCERMIGQKVEGVVVDKKRVEEQKKFIEELAKTGELPKHECSDPNHKHEPTPEQEKPEGIETKSPPGTPEYAPSGPVGTALRVTCAYVNTNPCETHEWDEPRTNQEGTLHLRQCKKCGIIDTPSIHTTEPKKEGTENAQEKVNEAKQDKGPEGPSN